MKAGNRSNALLVELLIVVMFFMLAATMLLQVFSKAYNLAENAEIKTRALNEAQNVADQMYHASSEAQIIEALQDMGFDFDAASGAYLEKDGYRLLVYRQTEERDAGIMHLNQVQAYQDDTLLFTLPVARYAEKEGAQP